MLHLGRCCGTPLVWEPAERGCGRRDAVATTHRLTQAFPLCYSLKNEPVCCNMISVPQSILELFSPSNTHVWKVNGCYRPHKSIVNNLKPTLFFSMRRTWTGVRGSNSLDVEEMIFRIKSIGDYFESSITQTGTSLPAYNDHHRGTTTLALFRQYAHLSMCSFWFPDIITGTVVWNMLDKSRLVFRWCFIPPRFFHNRVVWSFYSSAKGTAPRSNSRISENLNPEQRK